MRRFWLIGLAGVLALAAVVAYGLYATRPTPLRIAVGPPGGEDARLISAIAAQLGRDRDQIRLKPVPTDGPDDAAAAMQSGEVDLAVVRRDFGMPANGQAVALIRRNVIAVIVPPGSDIQRVGDLRGRKMGVIRRSNTNRMLTELLAAYDVPANGVITVPIDLAGIPDAVREGKIDALVLTAPADSRMLAEGFAAMFRNGEAPRLVPIPDAGAVSARLPGFEPARVAAGAFGSYPPRPAEGTETLGFSYYLVASRSVDENTVGEFTRLLFADLRRSVGLEYPALNRFEVPPADRDSAVAIHPGASGYFDGTQRTFFERHGDAIYWTLILLFGAGSVTAAAASYMLHATRKARRALLNRLLGMIRSANAAQSEAALDELQHQADVILGTTLEQAAENRLDQAGLAAFSLALEQVRQAIAARREVLAERPPAAEAPLRAVRQSSGSL